MFVNLCEADAAADPEPGRASGGGRSGRGRRNNPYFRSVCLMKPLDYLFFTKCMFINLFQEPQNCPSGQGSRDDPVRMRRGKLR